MYNKKKNNENKVSFLLPAHMSQEGKKTETSKKQLISAFSRGKG